MNFYNKIYFGHSVLDYNTEFENNCLNKIRELYPGCEIINPRDIEIEDEDKNPRDYATFMKQMKKYYFPAIKTCDLLIVAKTLRGKISPGVQKEIEFAKENNIPVKYLNDRCE